MSRSAILHVTPYGPDAWAYGGIPRVVAAQVRELGARGLRVVVATTDAFAATARLARPGGWPIWRPWTVGRDGVEMRVFPNLSNRLAHDAQLYVPVGLTRWLRRAADGIVVAHLHGCHNLPGALAARCLRRAGVPYVLQPNGTAPRIEQRRLAKRIFDATLGRGVLPGAARVVAVSDAERRDLEALGVAPERIAHIPNPVEAVGVIPPARGGFRAAHGLGPGPLVVYLGQLSPRKGVDTLVDAVARLGPPLPGLVIAGPDRGCLGALRRRAAAAGLAERAHFVGVLTGADRLSVLGDADVVAYPTEHEVFGLVPLEALVCGTPVVVGDDAGCREVVERTGGGLAVPPRNVAALAAGLTEMLAHREVWQARAAAAAQRVATLFAPAVVAAELVTLYEGVTGRML